MKVGFVGVHISRTCFSDGIIPDLQSKWNVTKRSFEDFENNVLATKVFLHKWAAKNQYFSAVHDRVISLRDHMDLQVKDEICSKNVVHFVVRLEYYIFKVILYRIHIYIILGLQYL